MIFSGPVASLLLSLPALFIAHLKLNLLEQLNFRLYSIANRVFSRDVTAARLVFLNNGTAGMLVSPTSPPGFELYYHANVFFCFGGKTRLLIT